MTIPGVNLESIKESMCDWPREKLEAKMSAAIDLLSEGYDNAQYMNVWCDWLTDMTIKLANKLKMARPEHAESMQTIIDKIRKEWPLDANKNGNGSRHEQIGDSQTPL